MWFVYKCECTHESLPSVHVVCQPVTTFADLQICSMCMAVSMCMSALCTQVGACWGGTPACILCWCEHVAELMHPCAGIEA